MRPSTSFHPSSKTHAEQLRCINMGMLNSSLTVSQLRTRLLILLKQLTDEQFMSLWHFNSVTPKLRSFSKVADYRVIKFSTEAFNHHPHAYIGTYWDREKRPQLEKVMCRQIIRGTSGVSQVLGGFADTLLEAPIIKKKDHLPAQVVIINNKMSEPSASSDSDPEPEEEEWSGIRLDVSSCELDTDNSRPTPIPTELSLSANSVRIGELLAQSNGSSDTREREAAPAAEEDIKDIKPDKESLDAVIGRTLFTEETKDEPSSESDSGTTNRRISSSLSHIQPHTSSSSSTLAAIPQPSLSGQVILGKKKGTLEKDDAFLIQPRTLKSGIAAPPPAPLHVPKHEDVVTKKESAKQVQHSSKETASLLPSIPSKPGASSSREKKTESFAPPQPTPCFSTSSNSAEKTLADPPKSLSLSKASFTAKPGKSRPLSINSGLSYLSAARMLSTNEMKTLLDSSKNGHAASACNTATAQSKSKTAGKGSVGLVPIMESVLARTQKERNVEQSNNNSSKKQVTDEQPALDAHSPDDTSTMPSLSIFESATTNRVDKEKTSSPLNGGAESNADNLSSHSSTDGGTPTDPPPLLVKEASPKEQSDSPPPMLEPNFPPPSIVHHSPLKRKRGRPSLASTGRHSGSRPIEEGPEPKKAAYDYDPGNARSTSISSPEASESSLKVKLKKNELDKWQIDKEGATSPFSEKKPLKLRYSLSDVPKTEGSPHKFNSILDTSTTERSLERVVAELAGPSGLMNATIPILAASPFSFSPATPSELRSTSSLSAASIRSTFSNQKMKPPKPVKKATQPCVFKQDHRGQFRQDDLSPHFEEESAFYEKLWRGEKVRYPKRDRVRPESNGKVYLPSGAYIITKKSSLEDRHNYRELQLGDPVWANWSTQYWPGFIKTFISQEEATRHLIEQFPHRNNEPIEGDVVLVEWMDGKHSYVCYNDVYRFDLYFAVFVNTNQSVQFSNNIARAIAFQGAPGYWEKHISPRIYTELVRMNANVSSIPAEKVQEYKRNVSSQKKTGVINKLRKHILQVEMDHFNEIHGYNDQPRNMTSWKPRPDFYSLVCNVGLFYNQDSDDTDDDEGMGMQTSLPPRKKMRPEDETPTASSAAPSLPLFQTIQNELDMKVEIDVVSVEEDKPLAYREDAQLTNATTMSFSSAENQERLAALTDAQEENTAEEEERKVISELDVRDLSKLPKMNSTHSRGTRGRKKKSNNTSSSSSAPNGP